MTLYLMQHGEAASSAADPARPLTDEGRAAVQRVAARARACGVRLDVCVHSGKLRAKQTAEILAEALGPDSGAQARDGLAPNDPVASTATWLRGLEQGRSVGVVGHLPFLDRLAGLLVADVEDAQVIRFRNAGLVRLEPTGDGAGFAVGWVLVPELA